MTLLKCSAHGYTLEPRCPVCGAATARPGPAKYSPEDPYGAYRRKLKLLARGEAAARARERPEERVREGSS